MVRGVLSGVKTQLRRPARSGHFSKAFHNRCRAIGVEAAIEEISLSDLSPLGKIGERLWIRETYGLVTGNGHRIVYRADGDPEQCFYPGEKIVGMKWRPCIGMPREASRITLEISDIRFGRLQDMSAQDAQAEGMERPDGIHFKNYQGGPELESPLASFKTYWNSTEHERESWDRNPWIWVTEFKRVPNV